MVTIPIKLFRSFRISSAQKRIKHLTLKRLWWNIRLVSRVHTVVRRGTIYGRVLSRKEGAYEIVHYICRQNGVYVQPGKDQHTGEFLGKRSLVVTTSREQVLTIGMEVKLRVEERDTYIEDGKQLLYIRQLEKLG